eukprot:4415996-Pyramimonas_sp.AAC.1
MQAGTVSASWFACRVHWWSRNAGERRSGGGGARICLGPPASSRSGRSSSFLSLASSRSSRS